MKLSEIKQFLAEGDIQLTKSLGQNFLHDLNQLRRIVTAAEVTRGDRVLEIGPGLGPLTELLVGEAQEVLGIEKDRRLFEVLKQRFASAQHLTLIQDDALDYLRREKRSWSDWKLVANLPYSVASPILVELAQAATGPKLMVATVQLEVAQRLFAQASQKDYGLLTLMVQLNYQPVTWFKIPAACFFPQPQIDSACVKLVRLEQSPLTQSEAGSFVKIVKRGFSQRRKMMLKLLKEDWPAKVLEESFSQLELSPQVRAEAVSVPQFVKLAQILNERGNL